MKIPFIGPQSESRSVDVDAQRTMNWYLEQPTAGRNQLVLYPTPGFVEFANIGAGPIRAMRTFGDNVYVVSGNKFYRVNDLGGTTELGILNTSGGVVTMADNGKGTGDQIIIADGDRGYLWDDSAGTFDNNLAGSTNYPSGATHVVFIDSYFVANDPSNSGRFYISNSYDGSTWDSLDFATAERDPDNLQGIIVSNRDLWLFGTQTAEVWYNAGAANFPFQPINNAFSEWGTVAPYSLAETDSAVFWLSQNESGQGLVMMAQGYQPEVISTPEISFQIADLGTINNAIGYTWQNYRHTFYVLTFPSEDLTLVYDVFSGMWFEWSTDEGRHQSNNHVFFDNKHLVGDFANGKVYELRFDTFTDNGTKITRLRRSPHIHQDDIYLFHHSVEVLTESGIGDFSDDTPQIMLRWSDDGGHTWSNEYWRDAGAQGEYQKRTVWRRLGRSRDRVYEIKTTDKHKFLLVDAFARVNSATRET